MAESTHLAIQASGVHHRYKHVIAVDDVSLDVAAGSSLALIGPDGVGKSTLLALLAGAKRLQMGQIEALGADIRRAGARARIQPRLAFMPQGLGRNLYATLTVRENVRYFASLFGSADEARIAFLLEAIGLAPFADRPAGKLSGGMKQKLGLCCALVHDPDLLILDEPTTGVDPLSRRQFWQLIDEIRASRPGMTLIVATSYMEEAGYFERVLLMQEGRIIGDGQPAALITSYSAASLEDVFSSLTSKDNEVGLMPRVLRSPPGEDVPIIVEGERLTRRFGNFTAVDAVDFKIRRGEIFGFLGSNGCGKTTVMKMLTGLLPANEGIAKLFGEPVDAGDVEARRKIGYMSQGFSLYGELTVRQNFDLHGDLFGLKGDVREARIAELVLRFGLAPYSDMAASAVPLGVRQRLSLAIAILHEPAVLILDEPTSGVDPSARDAFWREIERLASEQQITIFISTHFMTEAERCDRVAFMHAGRIIATGAPRALCVEQGVSNLEEAFIAYMRIGGADEDGPSRPAFDLANFAKPQVSRLFSPSRMLAVCRREAIELIREPVRLTIALVGTLILALTLGYGISFDVEGVTLAVLDHDRTPTSRAYIDEFTNSPYFSLAMMVQDDAEVTRALRTNRASLILDIPAGFGRNVLAGQTPAVAAWVDGAMPFRANTVIGYAQSIHQRAIRSIVPRRAQNRPVYWLEPRFRYNQGFRSLDAIAPVSMGILLALIPAILTALAIVREKDLGTITNFYVTPIKRFEFLAGKQLPYIAISFVNFLFLLLLAVTLFELRIKGSLPALILGGFFYVAATTAVGFVASVVTRSQTAAVFGTAMLIMMPAVQYSGLMQPVASLNPLGRWIGTLFPTAHFVRISVGVFDKGLSFSELMPTLAVLAAFWPALLGIALVSMRKQEA